MTVREAITKLELEVLALPDGDREICGGYCGDLLSWVMTVANPFIAKARLQSLRRYLPISRNFAASDGDDIPDELIIHTPLCERRIGHYNPDERFTLGMLSDIEECNRHLPQIDCGACGAPTCHAFAEDVIRGRANMDECVILSLRGKQKKEE